MGVDIYFVSGKNEFSCRLYWITNLIDDYFERYNKAVPNLIVGKNLNGKEIKVLYGFLKFSLLQLKNDKEKALSKFDSIYFKKIEEVRQLLIQVIELLNKKGQIDIKLKPKLQRIIARLENFNGTFNYNPSEQKKEIIEEYNEKVSLVTKANLLLKSIIEKNGSVSID